MGRLEAISVARCLYETASPQLNQERGCIKYAESRCEEGRGLVSWSDDSIQYLLLGMFV
jgi:hypothetical protein